MAPRSPTSSSARSRVGRRRNQEAQSGRQAAGRLRSPWCIVRTDPAPRSTSPTTSRQVSADWKDKVGTEKSVEWPVGLGAKGNEGVAATVQQTQGSIGYVEYAYAKQNNLTHTDMVNKSGKRVAPTSEAFSAAAGNADWKGTPGYGVILADEPGDSSLANDGATFILMYKKPDDHGRLRRSPQVLRLGVRQGRRDGDRTASTSRCPTRS